MADTPSLADICKARGLNLDVVMFDGVVISELTLDNMKSMKTRKLRKDDILLCTYPKSGTHWVWEILNMIVAGKAEYHKHWQNCSWLENRTEEELEELESPRILHTHLLPRMLPESVWNQKCKTVYVQRNLKDVVVSAYNQVINQVWKDTSVQKVQFSGTFDDFLDLNLSEAVFGSSWFNYVKDWNHLSDTHSNIEICRIHYEDMKKDCAREIKKMAEYLERPLPDKVYSEIADACSFNNLKHANENVKDQTYHYKWNKDSEGYFRKGIVGDWKNWFTVAQSERVDRVYEEKMKEKFPY